MWTALQEKDQYSSFPGREPAPLRDPDGESRTPPGAHHPGFLYRQPGSLPHAEFFWRSTLFDPPHEPDQCKGAMWRRIKSTLPRCRTASQTSRQRANQMFSFRLQTGAVYQMSKSLTPESLAPQGFRGSIFLFQGRSTSGLPRSFFGHKSGGFSDFPLFFSCFRDARGVMLSQDGYFLMVRA